MSKILYNNEETNLDLSKQVETSNFIKDKIIEDLVAFLGDEEIANNIDYQKITKNCNIHQVVERLKKTSHKWLCIYGYGEHLQKMISIIEIYKQKQEKQCRQWNRLFSFQSIETGRNELLEKRKKIPILISFITYGNDPEPLIFQEESYNFSKQ